MLDTEFSDLRRLLREILKADSASEEKLAELVRDLIETLRYNPKDESKIKQIAVALQGSLSIGGSVRDIYFNTKDETRTDSQSADSFQLQSYLRGVISATSKLLMKGIGNQAIQLERDNIDLVDVYVSLRAQNPTKQSDPTERFKNIVLRTYVHRSPSLISLVCQHQYLYLLGGLGTGKSTLVKFISACLAGEYLGHATANLRRLGQEWSLSWLLPLPIHLSGFASWFLSTHQSWDKDIFWQYISLTPLEGNSTSFAPELVEVLKHHLVSGGGILLLDGFDEISGTQFDEQGFTEVLEHVIADYPKCRIVITSRRYAYKKSVWRKMNFVSSSIAPLTNNQIEAFVFNWYLAAANQDNKEDIRSVIGKAVLLNMEIENNKNIADLAKTPILLTMLVQLHDWRGGILPSRREQVLGNCMNLLFDQWERNRRILNVQGIPVLESPSATEWFRTSIDKLLKVFEYLGFDSHCQESYDSKEPFISEAELITAFVTTIDDPDLRPQRILEFASSRSGLIEPTVDGKLYSFPHKVFQEYLAARYLSEHEFPDLAVTKFLENPAHWDEVILMVAEKVAGGTTFAVWALVEALCPISVIDIEKADLRSLLLAALMAAKILVATRVYENSPKRHQLKLEIIRKNLEYGLTTTHFGIKDRHLVGYCLGLIGDQRDGIGLEHGGTPNLKFIQINDESLVSIGQDESPPEIVHSESPKYRTRIPTFKISCFPVTNIQFDAFEQAGGYSSKDLLHCWTKEGQEWLRQGHQRVKPAHPFELPNHPVCNVNWYEAVAFCNWLTKVLKENCILTDSEAVCLPSEEQWEKGARGTDGRIYPWGNEFHAELCNSIEDGYGKTTAVGIFPAGRSPYTVEDMVGNVWEWCRDVWRSNYTQVVNLSLDGIHLRPLRGGSYSGFSHDVRCSSRNCSWPNYRSTELGFRVVIEKYC